MAPETPRQTESPEAVTLKVEDKDVFKESSAIRKKLRIPEEQDANWKEMMKLALSDVPEPKQKGDSSLHDAYRQLSAERSSLESGVLFPMMAYVRDPENREPSVTRAETVVRKTAQYIEALDVYMQRNEGLNPMQIRLLPQYFVEATHIRSEEALAVEVAVRILPFQYDIRGTDLTESPRILAGDAGSVLNAAARYDVKVGMISDAQGKVRTDDAACLEFLSLSKYKLENGQTTWPKDTLDATKFALRYLEKNHDLIAKFAASRNQPVQNISIAEALQCSTLNSPTGQLMGEVVSSSKSFFEKGQLPDMSSIAEGLLEKKDAFASQAMETALAPLAKLNPDPDPENFERDAAEVVKFFRTSGKLDSTQIENDASRMNPAPRFMILAINDRVLGSGAQNTIEFLRRSAFVTLDPEDGINERITDVLTKLVREKRITTQEVFEIYYLSESKGSALPAAFKVVSLLKRHGHKYKEPDLSIDLQAKINAQMLDLVGGSLDDASALAIKLNMDPVEMRNLQEYLKEAGLKNSSDWFKALLANMRESPWTTSIYLAVTGGPYVVGGGLTLAAVIKYFNVRGVVNFIHHDDMSTIRRKYNISDTVTDAEIMQAKERAKDFHGRYQRLALLNTIVPFAGRTDLKNAKNEIKQLRTDRPLVAQPAPDQSVPAQPVQAQPQKPLGALERARQREGGNLTGGSGSQANVAANTAKVSPNTVAKPAAETSDPNEKKKGLGESVSDFFKRRLGKK